MRLMVRVTASKASEAGVLPSETRHVELGKYAEKLIKAGRELRPACGDVGIDCMQLRDTRQARYRQ